MSGPILDSGPEWGFVYTNGRMLMCVAGGLRKHDGRRTLTEIDWAVRSDIILADGPEAGFVTNLRGRPLGDNERERAILDAVERGDYSWAEVSPRRKRADQSTSVFVPPTVSLEDLSAAAGARIWLDAATDELYEWFDWSDPDRHVVIRDLDPVMCPEPSTPEHAALQRDSSRWGGHNAWELIGVRAEQLGSALKRIADRHDLAIFTVADRYRTRADILAFENAYGEGWAVDYYDQTDIEIGPPRPQPPSPPPPRWHLAWPLRYFAVTYTDGAYFTLPGHNHTIEGDRHTFTVTLTDGQTATIAWATTRDTASVEPTEPRWHLPPPIE